MLKVSNGAAVRSPASGQLRDLIATCSDLTCLLFELVGESLLQRKLPHAGLEADVTCGFLVISLTGSPISQIGLGPTHLMLH